MQGRLGVTLELVVISGIVRTWENISECVRVCKECKNKQGSVVCEGVQWSMSVQGHARECKSVHGCARKCNNVQRCARECKSM